MNRASAAPSPAEKASALALEEVFSCIDTGDSFVLEAGAGAGKTYSLVEVLKYLMRKRSRRMGWRKQRVACITYTNVAKDEIEARIDRDPLVHCDTIHAFCWSLMAGFQRHLAGCLPDLEPWHELLEEVEHPESLAVEYTLGYRGVREGRASLHHDDVLSLAVALLREQKFRTLVAGRYPIILVDEYQDTNAEWVEAIEEVYFGQEGAPLFGFFGDPWQKIYGDGCGHIEHPALAVIGKHANFRSVATIVDGLNRMRPELVQEVSSPGSVGSVRVFHTNSWDGERRTQAHWKGDLPEDAAQSALELVRERLLAEEWRMDPSSTKILMLTHRVLAGEQGYGSIPKVFRYNESFVKKENAHIEFFVDELEPACESYSNQRYGHMFEVLGRRAPVITPEVGKKQWAQTMARLADLRAGGTVGEVVDYLRGAQPPLLPSKVEKRERELESFDPEAEGDLPRRLAELKALHEVGYAEVSALAKYLNGHSLFQTKHGVKGAEFENVLVVVGRGWNHYDFGAMLEMAGSGGPIPDSKMKAFVRSRNLFYVACSRPRTRLALLFTQELSEGALSTLGGWFGAEQVEDVLV